MRKGLANDARLERELLADALVTKYAGAATRIVLYNALGESERFERYGEVARRIKAH